MNIKYFVYFNTNLKFNIYAIRDSFVIFLLIKILDNNQVNSNVAFS